MNKKNKVLTAAVCGVIVSSIGAGFLLNKPKEEAACKPLPIGFHRVVWNNNIGMQRIAFTA